MLTPGNPRITDPTYTAPSTPRRRAVIPPISLPSNPDGGNGTTNTLIPVTTTTKSKAGERVLTYNGAGALHPIIYGEVHNVGAAISYWRALTAGKLLVRYVIGYGPIFSISNIRIDNKTLAQLGINLGTTGGPACEVYLGTASQAISPLMTFWRNTYFASGWIPSNFPGIASVIIEFPDYTDSNLASFPDITNFKCDVKGLLVRDPAQDATLVNRYFSEDAGLIIADLLSSKRYGGRVADSKINWAGITSDVSPFVLENLGGGVLRYPIGIFLNHKDTLDNQIDNIRVHAQLSVNYNNGLYNIVVDKAKADTGILFTDDDLLEGARLRVKGTSEVFNRVNVSYTDSASEWAQKSTSIEQPGLSTNSVPLNEKDFTLLGSRTLEQTNRIGTYLINRSLLDKEITFSTLQIGKRPLPGDRIKITSTELNLTNQDIIITDSQPNSGQWDFTAEFYDVNVYSASAQTQIAVIEPAYPSPHDVPAAPTSPVLTQEYVDHNIRIKIAFTPAPVSYNSQFTRILVRKTYSSVVGPWVTLSDTTDSVDYIQNTNDVGAVWDVQLFTVTAPPYSVFSSVLSGSITVTALTGFGAFGMIWPQYSGRKFLASPSSGALGDVDFRAIIAADIPTLNQNTTGSAATLTTPRLINGVSFNGSADITVGAAAGTLTGTTLAVTVVNSSLTSFGNSPTIVTPTIASFTNANHNHQGSTGGGFLDTAAINTGTLAAARMPALTGDVTTVAGAVATTLATVNSNVGTFGSATQVAQFSVNAKGLITAALNVNIIIAESSVTNLVSDLALKAPLASPAFTGSGSWDSPTFVVDSVNDRIGIGTASPAYSLHVKQTISGNLRSTVENPDTGNGSTSGIRLSCGGGNDAIIWLQSPSMSAYGGVDSLNIYKIGNTPIAILTNDIIRLFIKGDGNIGVGTTTPTLFKLQTAGNVGPDATFTYDLGAVATKWRTLYAAELRVETLVAQNTIATIGGRILVGPTTKLIADLTSGATTINVEDNQMVSGDRIYLETAPVGVQQIEYMAVTSGPTTITGGFSYTVTRDLDGSGANAWKAGDAVFNTGQTGNGFIDIYSVRGTKASTEIGPTIVGNIRNSSTFNDWSPRWAIGQLNGLYGYATSTYGAAFGNPVGAWVKIDNTNGVRLGFNTVTSVQIDSSGNASFTGTITAPNGLIGGWAITSTTIVSLGLTFNSSAGSITGTNFSITASGISVSSGVLGITGAVNTTGNIFSSLNISTPNCVMGTDITTTGFVSTGSVFKILNTQVVGSRGAAVADATNATDVITQLNALLARLRAATGHGLIS